MSDEPKANGKPNRSLRRRGSSSFTTLLLVAIVVALVVTLVVIILTPPTDTDTTDENSKQYVPADEFDTSTSGVEKTQSKSAAAPLPSETAPPADTAPPAEMAKPAIRLPIIAVPANSEQLQQEAEQVANRLQQQYPDLPQALNVVALLDSRIRRSGKAEELWQRCIELDPDQVAYYVNLAAIAMDRGNAQLAVDTLEEAVKRGLATPDVHHHLAVALNKLGRCEEAESIVQKALDVQPNASAYWTVLGQAQLKLRKAAEAETSLKKAIELGSRSANVYYALGNACAQQGKTEEAARYRKVFQEMKGSESLEKTERYEVLSTADALRTALTIYCEAAAVERAENSLESERLLMRAVALDPTNPTPCIMLADIYESAGKLAEARAVRERLIQLQPMQLIHYLMYAKLSAQLNDPQTAEATLKLALAMQPGSLEMYVALAEFYLEQGKPKLARWYAQEVIKSQPSAEGYRFLAAACEAAGDQDDARAARAKADSLGTSGPKPQQSP